MYKLTIFILLIFSIQSYATDYHVGQEQPLATISEVPWSTLQAGDRVYIHWRADSYKEKWVINRQGTAENPIEIIGINGPQGQQPVINGNGAVTVDGVNFTEGNSPYEFQELSSLPGYKLLAGWVFGEGQASCAVYQI